MQFTVATAAVAFASVAVAQGGYTTSPGGKITCDKPNAAYCAGGSGSTNIIIRCDANGVGQAGNCNDNLSGIGSPNQYSTALCFAPCGPSLGAAACSKNGTVYPDSGAELGTDPFPTNNTYSCPLIPTPETNGTTTNPGGPIMTGTGPAWSGTGNGTTGSECTCTAAASPACTTGSGPSSGPGTGSGSEPSNTPPAPSTSPPSGGSPPYQGAAIASASASVMGAGAVVGFVAMYAALGMM